MGIGASFFFIAVGAILTFAVRADLGWLDLDVVGWVLMSVGVAGLGLTLYFWNRRRRRAVVEHVYRDSRGAPPVSGVGERGTL